MKVEDLTKEERVFLDRVATEVVKQYIEKRPPQGDKDSKAVARVGYRVAVQMLDTKRNLLSKLLEPIK